MRKFAFLFFVTLLAACGGGGGDNNNINNIDLSGTWRMNLALTENTCDPLDAQDENPTSTITVVQAGNAITVVDEENETTNCILNNNRDGFTCNLQGPAVNCTFNSSFTFNNASDGAADVALTSTVNCPSSEPCHTTFTGTAARL